MLLPAYRVAEILVALEFGAYMQLLFEILQGEPAIVTCLISWAYDLN